MDSQFKSALTKAKEIVATWPAWKQTSLIVTAMATSPQPREPGGVGVVDVDGYGDSRSQLGAEDLPIGWSVSIVGDQVTGSGCCTGGMDTQP